MRVKTLLPMLAALLSASTAFAELSITRSAFARDVTAREPEGVAESFRQNVGKVIFFNQFSGVTEPMEVKHVWIFDNRVQMEVKLPLEMEGWRVWSVKKIDPAQVGVWNVEVLDKAGNVLESATFNVER